MKKRRGFHVEPIIISTKKPLSWNIRAGTVAWTILNYVVNEPGEWTLPSIADDMGVNTKLYGSVRGQLVKAGYITMKDAFGRNGAHRLLPTNAGREAFMRSE